MDLLDKMNESSRPWRKRIKALFFFGILLLLGPGLLITNVSEIINQRDDFSFWGGDYGPDDPEFAGEVVWEGTTDETWTVELSNNEPSMRVWIEEGKTVEVTVAKKGASFERCDSSECDYFNNADESIPEYEFIGHIGVNTNNTYDVQFTSTGENNETTSIIVTREIFPTPGMISILLVLVGTLVTCVMILFAYHITLEIREKSENNNGNQEPVPKGNWIGPDGTESGPGVSENWYLTYDGPAPIVEDVYDENYVVDRGNGTIPVDFYIKKWGVPDGFGNTDYEKLRSKE